MLYVHLLYIDTFPLSNSLLFALTSLFVTCMASYMCVCVSTQRCSEKNLFLLLIFAEGPGPLNGVEDVRAGDVEAN